MLDFSAGIAGPFLQIDGRVQPYSIEPSRTWIPSKVVCIQVAIKEANHFSYNHQIKELENAAGVRDKASRSSDRKVIKRLKDIKRVIDRNVVGALTSNDGNSE
jgi:hypothetical protein